MVTDGPKTLDPVRGSTVYDNRAASQVYETLLQYKYLVRPPTLEPLLLVEMPNVSEDGRVYHFKLKPGVKFHDDPCFPGGKGREVVSSDVFYSWKRMADNENIPKGWWLFKNTIAGFDEYRETQNNAAKFDYNVDVSGFEITNDHEFKVTLTEPVHRFMYTLAMFQLAVVPHEAVEHYGAKFGRHPVGTGPFIMREKDWVATKSIIFRKNPNYHECYYPSECMSEDKEAGLDTPAGLRLPLPDRIEVSMFVESQPMWLQFRSKNLDFTTVPAENFDEAFVRRTRKLRSDYRREGVRGYPVPLLDFIFRGFNMEDQLLGGYDEKRKALRQAICSAIDLDEFNEAYYNNINIVYDGPIPPGLDGYPDEGIAKAAYRGPDLQRVRELLKKAGYPNGKGLPPIQYMTNRSQLNQEMAEMMVRQLNAANIVCKPQFVDFSTLIDAVDNKRAQFFGFAWGSDYPDPENNLALFYSPNKAPGANHFNYDRKEYDAMYEKIRVMPPSPERTKILEQMRDMLLEDCPFSGSMARTRFYLANPRLTNFKPTEDFGNWYKYLDVDDSKK